MEQLLNRTLVLNDLVGLFNVSDFEHLGNCTIPKGLEFFSETLYGVKSHVLPHTNCSINGCLLAFWLNATIDDTYSVCYATINEAFREPLNFNRAAGLMLKFYNREQTGKGFQFDQVEGQNKTRTEVWCYSQGPALVRAKSKPVKGRSMSNEFQVELKKFNKTAYGKEVFKTIKWNCTKPAGTLLCNASNNIHGIVYLGLRHPLFAAKWAGYATRDQILSATYYLVPERIGLRCEITPQEYIVNGTTYTLPIGNLRIRRSTLTNNGIQESSFECIYIDPKTIKCEDNRTVERSTGQGQLQNQTACQTRCANNTKVCLSIADCPVTAQALLRVHYELDKNGSKILEKASEAETKVTELTNELSEANKTIANFTEKVKSLEEKITELENLTAKCIKFFNATEMKDEKLSELEKQIDKLDKLLDEIVNQSTNGLQELANQTSDFGEALEGFVNSSSQNAVNALKKAGIISGDSSTDINLTPAAWAISIGIMIGCLFICIAPIAHHHKEIIKNQNQIKLLKPNNIKSN